MPTKLVDNMAGTSIVRQPPDAPIDDGTAHVVGGAATRWGVVVTAPDSLAGVFAEAQTQLGARR
jgi:hypothetical protein